MCSVITCWYNQLSTYRPCIYSHSWFLSIISDVLLMSVDRQVQKSLPYSQWLQQWQTNLAPTHCSITSRYQSARSAYYLPVLVIWFRNCGKIHGSISPTYFRKLYQLSTAKPADYVFRTIHHMFVHVVPILCT